MATVNLTGGYIETDYFISSASNREAVSLTTTPATDESANAIIWDYKESTFIQARDQTTTSGHYKGFTIDINHDGAYAPLDLTNRVFAITSAVNYQGVPQDSTGKRVDTVANNGHSIILIDGSGNWRQWTVSGNDIDNYLNGWQNHFIDPSDTSTMVRESGTLDVTDIVSMTCLWRQLSSKAQAGLSAGGYLDPYKYTGGTAGGAIAFDGCVTKAAEQSKGGYRPPMFFDSFLSQYQIAGMNWIGDGAASATHFTDSDVSIEFPALYSGTGVNSRHNVPANVYGFGFDVTSDYAANLDRVTFSSASDWRFEVVANGNTTQTLNLTDCAITRAGVFTLDDPAVLTGCRMTSCGQIALNDATLADCIIASSSDAGGALSLDRVDKISGLTFKDNSVDIVIEATAPASIDLSSHTFTASPGIANIIDMRAGNVTISVGDSVPTVKVDGGGLNDGGGTTTLVEPPKTITAANMPDGARVQIYNVTKGAEIDNSVVSGGAGYSIAVTAIDAVPGDTIRMRAMFSSGVTYKEPLDLLGEMGSTTLAFINSFTNWEAVNLLAIDGSTCTEFLPDFPNIQVDINDPNNITQKTRLVAWYAYTLTTEDGIRHYFGAIDVEDSSNFKINQDIVDLKLDNTKAVPLLFDDAARLYRADGSTVIAATSNSIQLDAGKVRQITVSGASVLSAEESAKLDDIAGIALQMDELHKINGLDASNPLTTTTTLQTAGGITQTFTGNGETETTVTRT